VAWVPLDDLSQRLSYDTERKLLSALPEQFGAVHSAADPPSDGPTADGG